MSQSSVDNEPTRVRCEVGVVRADWNASGAYTKLDPTPTWPPFVLRNRLFYANMESPVSCMETQIIAGKNAALLVAEALPL